MAIYHLSAKVIGRAAGRSAVGAAAYRSASALIDQRQGRVIDHSDKDDVIHSEVLLPEGAPERLRDRGTLWNEVEAVEKRVDAQLAREVEFAIPREFSRGQAVALAQDFVREQFVAKGMVADLNVHWSIGEDGEAKPHAHVMLATREVGPDGFGKKVRAWNAKAELQGWREAWAEIANERLAVLGHEARIDHRSLRDQGIELSPQHKIGPAGARREERGQAAERADEHRQIARDNGERIAADPGIALNSITHQQSTFSRHDLARFVHRHSDGAEQFADVMAKVEASPEVVRLGKDAKGKERFTTREMLGVEARLEGYGQALAAAERHGVGERHRAAALAGRELGPEQRGAFERVTGDGGLALVVGYAGTGKSTMLGAAREAWEAQGYTVHGAALSGIAAEGLEAGAGIRSRTLASYEYAWGQGKDALSSKDVLVIDEAGLVGSRQMERVLAHAGQAGAKVVLVGDPEQLQAIEAGAGFRALVERHGAAEITQVRRQREGWQREATVELATGRTGEALGRYTEAGMVVAHDSREVARAALVERWDTRRAEVPGESAVILAYTRDDVRELNALARSKLVARGEIGAEAVVATERGARSFGAGDRVMFLRNERDMGVKNGTLGTVMAVESGGERLTVRLDGAGKSERDLTFYARDYGHIDHGYAATVHKAQGVTVDRAYLLGSDHLDRHAAYVGLTRHRDAVELHYAREDFATPAKLVQQLGRERAKDTTLDYAQGFAERRGLVSEIVVPEVPRAQVRVPEPVAQKRPEKKQGMFAGFAEALTRSEGARGAEAARGRGGFAGLELGARGGVGSERSPGTERAGHPMARAARAYADAWTDARGMKAAGLPVLEHQREVLARASSGLERLREHGARDLATALDRRPELAAAQDGDAGLVAAMAHEAEVRRDPALRAGRFVERWRAAEKAGARDRMDALSAELKRDPQVHSLLRGHAKAIAGANLPELERAMGIGGRQRDIDVGSRSRDRGMSR